MKFNVISFVCIPSPDVTLITVVRLAAGSAGLIVVAFTTLVTADGSFTTALTSGTTPSVCGR